MIEALAIRKANRLVGKEPGTETGALATARLLRGVRLFEALDERELREVADRGIPRTLAHGAVLFRKGERCSGLHVVLEGRVEIYATSPEGREQVLHRIGARQAVTELPLFGGTAYPATARVATRSRILFVTSEVIERLADAHPAMLRVVIGDLGRSIRRLTQLVEKVSLKDVRARVATAVLEQAWAGGTSPAGRPFRLAWTQEQMAHALGVTRESVARGLARLRRDRLIEQDGRNVRILDLEALTAIADGRVLPESGRRAHPSPAATRIGAHHAVPDGPCC